MSTIKLKTSDEIEFVVDLKVAKLSGLINQMLEIFADNEEEDTESIPLQNVDSKTLKKIIEWGEQREDPTSTEDANSENSIAVGNSADYDANLMKQLENDRTLLFQLTLAANYLDIDALQCLTAQTIANMAKDKSPQEVRELFAIQNDFTPEEELQIRLENDWCQN